MEVHHRGADLNFAITGPARANRHRTSGWDCRPAQDKLAVCHQVTTLDRAKLAQRLGTLPSESLREVEQGLKAAVDLD